MTMTKLISIGLENDLVSQAKTHYLNQLYLTLVLLWQGEKQHNIAYSEVFGKVEHWWNFELPTDTPYLTMTGDPCDV